MPALLHTLFKDGDVATAVGAKDTAATARRVRQAAHDTVDKRHRKPGLDSAIRATASNANTKPAIDGSSSGARMIATLTSANSTSRPANGATDGSIITPGNAAGADTLPASDARAIDPETRRELRETRPPLARNTHSCHWCVPPGGVEGGHRTGHGADLRELARLPFRPAFWGTKSARNTWRGLRRTAGPAPVRAVHEYGMSGVDFCTAGVLTGRSCCQSNVP